MHYLLSFSELNEIYGPIVYLSCEWNYMPWAISKACLSLTGIPILKIINIISMASCKTDTHSSIVWATEASLFCIKPLIGSSDRIVFIITVHVRRYFKILILRNISALTFYYLKSVYIHSNLKYVSEFVCVSEIRLGEYAVHDMLANDLPISGPRALAGMLST